MKKICIIDYGLGNIKSLYNSLNYIGYKPVFLSETKLKTFDVLFIPGVGSFAKASNLLLNSKFSKLISDAKNESLIFGICLGMQIFFSTGEENGLHNGLNLIEGNVSCFKNKKQKNITLPNVGLRNIFFKQKCKYLNNFNNKKFYFIHSYVANLKFKQDLLASSLYENIEYPALVKRNRVIGTQFHPEKSGSIGLDFLKTVIENY